MTDSEKLEELEEKIKTLEKRVKLYDKATHDLNVITIRQRDEIKELKNKIGRFKNKYENIYLPYKSDWKSVEKERLQKSIDAIKEKLGELNE